MGNNSSTPAAYNAAMYIFDFNSAINVLASLLNLMLIWYMRRNGSLKMNLYLTFVFLMTIHQLLYDTALLLDISCVSQENPTKTCYGLYAALSTLGGIGAAVWSMLIIGVTAFVVEFGRQPTDYEKYLVSFLSQSFIFGWTIFCTVTSTNYAEDPNDYNKAMIYYTNCRLVIIGITILLMMLMYYRMRQFTQGMDQTQSPLYHLTRRLIFYPVVQVLSRLGQAPYVLIYQSAKAGTSGSALFWFYVYVISAPMAGIGDFLIFLLMQNGAKENLYKMLRCECGVRSKLLERGGHSVSGERWNDAENGRSESVGKQTLQTPLFRSQDYAPHGTASRDRAAVQQPNVSVCEPSAGAEFNDADLNRMNRYSTSSMGSSHRDTDTANSQVPAHTEWSRLKEMDEDELILEFIHDRSDDRSVQSPSMSSRTSSGSHVSRASHTSMHSARSGVSMGGRSGVAASPNAGTAGAASEPAMGGGVNPLLSREVL